MGRFAGPGKTVLVKPNLLVPQPPEKAITTHPLVLKSVLQLVQEAGGRPLVGDSPSAHKAGHERLWTKTGMLGVCNELGVELVRFESETVTVKAGQRMLCLSARALNADAIVSVPKFKTHALTLMTCAIKNLYGVVPGYSKTAYHMEYSDPVDFAELLVSIFERARPALTVVDAVIGLQGNGPSSGGRPRHVGLIIAGTDAVAIDAVCAHLMGFGENDVMTTNIAARRGLGVKDLAHIRIDGPPLESVKPQKYLLPIGVPMRILPAGITRIAERLLWIRPSFRQNCRRCGECSSKCPAGAIRVVDGRPDLISGKCIECLCCLEACPHDAVAMKYSFLAGLFLA
ncbi:MAG: DUF362 domain-containing protein [Planctomycetota bacterium]|nr:DUF362 domain-containing protein [Planctomycetota bacterium]